MSVSLKSWRDVIVPHNDVRTGALHASTFAADLTQVVRGTAPEQYTDPRRFFERTLITEGMARLLTSVVKRMSGQGGDPVLQLQTAFGGGKTHTLIAVYHVVCGKTPASEMAGVPSILDAAGVPVLPQGRVAVLDGVALGPDTPRTDGGVERRTLWGELAYQLGGAAGYDLVARADASGTSPGKDVLVEILDRFGPCVVLVDEATRYLSQFKPGQTHAGGTFDSNLSFVQALTEAVSAAPRAMLLASLPESETEVGDVDGHRAFDALKRYFGRIEAVWKPVEQAESYEIVRRRLFGDVQDLAARDAVVNAYAGLYAAFPDLFPSETRTPEYRQLLRDTYPVHPEVFARLYEDWSTLPKFQRTRGVLRLMAHLVQRLWSEGSADTLILPGSFALDTNSVRSELVQHLDGSGWDAVVEKDVDGAGSGPRKLDAENPVFGAVQAARRAARTIFLGSAPSVGAQNVRGLTPESVRLGCTQPGQSPAIFSDAARALSDRLHYLYTSGERGTASERYWYDMRPNLRRTMEERLGRIDESAVREMVQAQLEGLGLRGQLFGGVHVFRPTGDVPDDDSLRLVVLPLEATHRGKNPSSRATTEAARYIKERGAQPRLRAHRLVFLAPDEDVVMRLRQQARTTLAWSGIVQDHVPLNLDQFNLKQAREQEKDSKKAFAKTLQETYVWALAPFQHTENAGAPVHGWEDARIEQGISSLQQALERVLVEKEMVVPELAPSMLRRTLDAFFFSRAPEVTTRALWEAFYAYPYLPRLASRNVLTRTIQKGTAFEDFFGLASGKRPTGGYDGLYFGASGEPYYTDGEVLLHPDAARAARPAPPPVDPSPVGGFSSVPTGQEEVAEKKQGDWGSTGGPPLPSTTLKRGFFGTVQIEPNKARQRFGQVVEELVNPFAQTFGSIVTITVEVRVEMPNGLTATQQASIQEWSKALAFDQLELF